MRIIRTIKEKREQGFTLIEVVFVIMLCEGAFPSARAIEALDGEEEEREGWT